MMVCEGCGAVCACSRRGLQIVDLPVDQKNNIGLDIRRKNGARGVFID